MLLWRLAFIPCLLACLVGFLLVPSVVNAAETMPMPYGFPSVEVTAALEALAPRDLMQTGGNAPSLPGSFSKSVVLLRGWSGRGA
jgi:hypothetical protein